MLPPKEGLLLSLLFYCQEMSLMVCLSTQRLDPGSEVTAVCIACFHPTALCRIDNSASGKAKYLTWGNLEA